MTTRQTIEFHIQPQGEVLQDFYDDWSDFIAITGPLGSGKTIQTILKLMRIAQAQAPNVDRVRPSRFAAIRNTYPDLQTTTIKDFMAIWRPLGRLVQTNPPVFYGKWAMPDGTKVEVEVFFIALDDESAVRKVRGTQFNAIWLNELKELSRAVVMMLDLRHGRYPSMIDGGVRCGWHGMIGDQNAPDEDHWLYPLIQDPPEGWSFHRQPGGVIKAASGEWLENPDAENLLNLPDEYYLRGMRGKSDDWINVNLANNYGFYIDGRAIYSDYSDIAHCPGTTIEWRSDLTLEVGLDYGFSPAAVFGQRHPSGRWIKLSEYVPEDLGTVRFAQGLSHEIQTKYPGAILNITGDPAGDSRDTGDEHERTTMQIMAAHGIDARAAQTNNPVVRIESVSQAMRLFIDGKPGLHINPECKKLRKAYAGGYCYRRIKGKDGQYRDKPDKDDYSHIADADQYMHLGAGDGRGVIRNRRQKFMRPVQIQIKRAVR